MVSAFVTFYPFPISSVSWVSFPFTHRYLSEDANSSGLDSFIWLKSAPRRRDGVVAFHSLVWLSYEGGVHLAQSGLTSPILSCSHVSRLTHDNVHTVLRVKVPE